MRILFTFTGGVGHLEPLVPIARAAGAAGHAVAFTSHPGMVDAARARRRLAHEQADGVLAEPGYRLAAERMRVEIERLPGPERAVELLERLAGTGTAFERRA